MFEFVVLRKYKDYAFCLDKVFNMESLISLENELLVCSEDPNGNKRRLLFKFSEELSYCMQVAFKINVKIDRDKVKEAQKVQRRMRGDELPPPCHWKKQSRGNSYISLGKINDRLPYSWLATTRSAGSPLQSIFVVSAERVKKFNSL